MVGVSGSQSLINYRDNIAVVITGVTPLLALIMSHTAAGGSHG